MTTGTLPPRQGLYDPANEHDACGVGFVANVKGRKSHELVRQGLCILENLTHRGAVGADPCAGDGAGILIQIPDTFLREECNGLGISLPEAEFYGVGMLFLPQPQDTRHQCEQLIEQTISEEGQSLIGWRDVPTNNNGLGKSVKLVEPVIRQAFISRGDNCTTTDDFERKLFIIRKRVENAIRTSGLEGSECFYVPSMSARTVCYKGMLLANQVNSYYADLNDERVTTALALVHQRFSTNTFPSWDLAHPFRMIAHNGEINTMRGNINWMNARRHSMESALFGDDLQKLWPLIAEGQSDSACFDNALELLVTGGYSMAQAMMLLIPEAWAGNPLMDEKRRAFYEYHAAVMEPWDGPAAVAFTDGRQIGATLDRNGLRPARYLITDDDLVVMASEMGVLDIPEERIVKKWRLQPGKMFLIDMEQGRIIDDKELKDCLASSHPYQEWLHKTQIRLENLPGEVSSMAPDTDTLLDRQQAFGYTQEDIKFLMTPMAATGQEAIGSMGADNPVAVLSNKAKPLANYFKQNFAQVTNPPIDPIREELVMSLVTLIGPRPNLLGHESAGEHMRLEVSQPILTNTDIERIRHIKDHTDGAFRTKTLDICYPATNGADGMEAALSGLCEQAEALITTSPDNLKDWQEQTNAMNELFNVWRSIGRAPRKENAEVWTRFKGSMNTFFANRKEFLNSIKQEQMNNYNLKVDLCVEAENLKDSTDWRTTTQQLIRLQQDWKKIGPIPRKHSDKIWKRFRAACDEFFNNKSSHFSSIHENEQENLDKKKELIEKIKAFEFGEDKSKNLDLLKDFQREWMEIGYVPMKEKEKVQKQFRVTIDARLDDLKISSTELSNASYATRMEAVKGSPDADRVYRKEVGFLMNKISKLKDDIILWENNLGFFANSKKADILKQEFEQKLDLAKQDVAAMEAKVKYLRKMASE